MLVVILFSGLITFFYIGLFLYYIYGWIKLKEWKVKEKKAVTKITVIVPARNEADNILYCLKDLGQQLYPKELFEIIVVDDNSTDNTVDLVEKLRIKNLRLIKSYSPSKKKAIEKGIENAKGNLIVTTDADCRMGKQWLASIASFYEVYKPKMISAPTSYLHNNTFFKIFQALDFIGMVGIGAASIRNGFPHVCNGANLSYEKSVYYEVGGFKGIDTLASGDDMLLMQKITKKYPTGIKFLKNMDAIVYTKAKKTVQEFIQQRLRWASKTSVLVDKKVTAILVGVLFFNITIIFNSIFVLYKVELLIFLLFQLAVKFLLDFIFLGFVSKFFRQIKLLWLFLPSQVIHIFYIVFIGLLANFKRYNWKDRIVR